MSPTVVANDPRLVPPVCVQHSKFLPNAPNVPYYFYHCPPISTNTSYILPDLQINVDFSPLMDGLSNMVQSSARTQLPLLIGLSNNIYDDLIRTVPVAFLPGVNMAASVIVDVRQVYTNGALAALGMFEVSLYQLRSPRFFFYSNRYQTHRSQEHSGSPSLLPFTRTQRLHLLEVIYRV